MFGGPYHSKELRIRGPKTGAAATIKNFAGFGTPGKLLDTATGDAWPREGDKEEGAFTSL